MEKKPCNDGLAEVSRSVRDLRPAHYLFKIESFSILLEEKIEKYESDDFQAGGYQWELCLYPNGNKKGNGKDHISLYLVIKDTDNLPHGWEVNVQFKLFVFDHIRDKYLTIQDAEGKIRRFHRMKTEWGFAQLLSLDTFNDTSNGYLLEDSCIFGAEVFVIEYAGKGECMSMIKVPKNNTFTWKVDNFSTITDIFLCSDEFKVGERKWKLELYPRGNAKPEGESLSLFLAVADYEALPLNWKVYAKFKLRIKDQINGSHIGKKNAEGKIRRFHGMKTEWGFAQLLSRNTFNNTSNGYLLDDSCVFGAEVFVIEYAGKGECMSMIKEPKNNTFTWKVDNFSTITDISLCSDEFKVGEQNWKLELYPRGNAKPEGECLSLFLAMADYEALPLNWKVYAKFMLRIRDQILGRHIEKQAQCWFCASTRVWGFSSFEKLRVLNDDWSGFITKDTLIVEVEIMVMSAVKNFP